jgi:hypothetical protein
MRTQLFVTSMGFGIVSIWINLECYRDFSNGQQQILLWVQPGFSDVHIKDQCLVENNICINATDAGWMLNIRHLVRNTRLRRIRHRVTSGKYRVCPVQNIYSNIMLNPIYIRKLGKTSKASKRVDLNLKLDDTTVSLRNM